MTPPAARRRELVAEPLARLHAALGRELCEELLARSLEVLEHQRHGELDDWLQALEVERPARPCFDFARPEIRVGEADDLSPEVRVRWRAALRRLIPWRKGPFRIFGVPIDTEWRSDWKWERVAPAVEWSGARVLDVGCANGYYALRAQACGASAVLGIDPSQLCLAQFSAACRGVDVPVAVLPLRLEQLPLLGSFDVVLSFGVLGHCREPLRHLALLAAQLRPGGRLLLETLIVAGSGRAGLPAQPEAPPRAGQGSPFEPHGRYAGMRNVYQLPDPELLLAWVRAAGFRDVRLLDRTPTTPLEQRRTEWMPFHSLADRLDPNDPTRTVEGHPAPLRAVVTASR